MPKSWSEAVKRCRKHPTKVKGRWCSCRTGWRYRMGLPDAVTGVIGKPEWSETFPTKDAADAHQRATRQAITNKSYVQDQGLTIAEYLDRWLEDKRRSGIKRTTVNGYADVVKNHLRPALGKHRLGSLRPDHVQAMLSSIGTEPSKARRAPGVTPPPATAGTMVNVKSVLRNALNDAVRQQLVPRNVATLVKVPTPRRRKPVALGTDRLSIFLTYAHEREHPLYSLWYLVAVYGMRRGESVGFSWKAVDRERKLLHVRRTILEVPGDHLCQHCRKTHRRLTFDVPKTAAGERIYPLVPAVVEVLDQQLASQQEQRELYGSDYADHGLVFARGDGNPWRPDWISNQFVKVMRESGAAKGLERVPSIKALRSTMVTNLHEAGTPLEVISKLTGHTGGEVTREHYLHVSAERTRTEFGDIARRIAPQAEPQDEPETGQERSDPLGDPHPVTEAESEPEGGEN